MKKKPSLVCCLLLSSVLLSGCATTITNLTPSTQTRNPSSLYPFEVALDTRDRCIKRETIQPFLVIGSEVFPMRPTLGLPNRWETVVEVPPSKEYVSYRFKFDYQTRGIPEPKPGSKLSPPFQLQVVDR